MKGNRRRRQRSSKVFVDFDPAHEKIAGDAPPHMNTNNAAIFPSDFGDDGLIDCIPHWAQFKAKGRLKGWLVDKIN
ncbi:hypothetical protein N9F34_03970 [Alphaproteobacteria bacterium]|nr:hypothetical protein [Alphaproteobacteria bacterium]